MPFLGVKLATVAEGEIGDLHVGLKGAMNALYLKDLADKTRRGLEGRVRALRSGGGLCDGYDVVTDEERGGRAINPEQASDRAADLRRVRRRPLAEDDRAPPVAAYHQEINAGRDTAAAERAGAERELRAAIRKLESLNDAVADGLRTPGLVQKIKTLETQKAELDAPAPSPARLHPNLAEVYRQKATELRQSLAGPLVRDEATGILRCLIEEVRLGHGEDGWSAELKGEIVHLVARGLGDARASRPGSRAETLCSAKMVAGARNRLNLLFMAHGLGDDAAALKAMLVAERGVRLDHTEEVARLTAI